MKRVKIQTLFQIWLPALVLAGLSACASDELPEDVKEEIRLTEAEDTPAAVRTDSLKANYLPEPPESHHIQYDPVPPPPPVEEEVYFEAYPMIREEYSGEVVIREERSYSDEVAQVSVVRSNQMHIAALTPGVMMDPGPPQATLIKGENPDEEVSGETYPEIRENPYLSPVSSPMSTFSIDADGASYTNVRRFIESWYWPTPDVMRTEEMVNYFKYDHPQPEDDKPVALVSEMGPCSWNKAHQLVYLGMQARTIHTDSLPPSNLVFLLDVSGSMSSPNKLPLVKEAFHLLVDQLRAEDRVSIVVYAGAAGVVLDPTSGDNKQKILGALDQLSAGGSTAGGAGIQKAYDLAVNNFIKGGNNRVILATDGDFNVGISDTKSLEDLISEKRGTGVFLSVLGFGMGNYRDDMMQTLAQKGNGNAFYIDDIREARRIFMEEMMGTLYTLAKDVKIQVEFNPRLVEGYRLIGYETRLLANEDFDDDTKDAGELGAGHSVTALYEIIPAGGGEHLPLPPGYDAEAPQALWSEDVMLKVRFRYKEPDEEVSKLVEDSLVYREVKLKETSENFRWSSAVAQYALKLRKSQYRGKSRYHKILRLARQARGEDDKGHRKEFIELVRQTRYMGNRPHLWRN